MDVLLGNDHQTKLGTVQLVTGMYGAKKSDPKPAVSRSCCISQATPKSF